MDLNKRACNAESDTGCGIRNDRHVLLFGFVFEGSWTILVPYCLISCVWGVVLVCFGSKIGRQKQPWAIVGPSREKSLENDAKMVAHGGLWEHLGDLKGLLGRSWGRFGPHLWVCRRCFRRSVLGKCDCVISTPFCSGIATSAALGDQVGATWT